MKEKTVLLIIDMINKMDFVGNENLLKHTKLIIEPLLNLKRHAKEQGIPIVYVNDNYGMWTEDKTALIKEAKKGIAKEIIEEIEPSEGDIFLIKPKHSGFYGTQLQTLLNDIGAKNLILTGIAGDFCVTFTAFDAYMLEYKLWVPSNCIASETIESNNNALYLLKNSMNACIDCSDETELEKVFK